MLNPPLLVMHNPPLPTHLSLLSTGRMLQTSIGNHVYLGGHANSGFHDQLSSGKVASMGLNDDHVYMRIAAHAFGIEAEVSPAHESLTAPHVSAVRMPSKSCQNDTIPPIPQAIARASSIQRVINVILFLEDRDIHHLPHAQAAAWGITPFDLGTMAQTPPHFIYVPGKHLKNEPLPDSQNSYHSTTKC